MVKCLIFTGLVLETVFGRAAGAYRIATELRAAGYSTQVVDFFHTYDVPEIKTILDRFLDRDTLFVGFSTTFFAFTNWTKRKHKTTMLYEGVFTNDFCHPPEVMHEVFEHIRKLSPKTKIVMGGGKAIATDTPGVDIFVQGYADVAVVELAKYLNGKDNRLVLHRAKRADASVINGDDYKFDVQRAAIVWEPQDLLADQETLPIEIARGCIFRCAFCSYPLNGKKTNDYIKDGEVLYREFMRNYELYGTTRYIYADDTHNDTIDKLRMMAEIRARLPFDLEYAAYLRLDLIHAHPEMAQLLLDGGIKSAVFGIETLNHASGKAIGKGLHPDKAIETLNWLRNTVWGKRVRMHSGFIVGLPYETEESLGRLLEWTTGNDCPLDTVQFVPLYINFSASGIYRSKFDIDAAKWGYAAPEDGGFGWRKSDGSMDHNRARVLAVNMSDTMYDQQRVGGFYYIMLNNYGFSQSEIDKMTFKQLHDDADRLHGLQHVHSDQYRKKLLSLPHG